MVAVAGAAGRALVGQTAVSAEVRIKVTLEGVAQARTAVTVASAMRGINPRMHANSSCL